VRAMTAHASPPCGVTIGALGLVVSGAGHPQRQARVNRRLAYRTPRRGHVEALDLRLQRDLETGFLLGSACAREICLRSVYLELCPDDQTQLEMPEEDEYSRRIRRAVKATSRKGARSPYDAVVVDETQDLDVQRLALIRLLAGKGRDSLTLLGDMNQRIYGEPLDLEDLHISVEGRTFSLAAGYRTTREIAELSQRLLPAETGAVPDIAATLDAPASGVSGPPPVMAELPSLTEEAVAVAMAILSKLQAGVPPDRIAVFARRWKRLRGVGCELKAAGGLRWSLPVNAWQRRRGTLRRMAQKLRAAATTPA